jgi:DivIVA domain-containing protein
VDGDDSTRGGFEQPSAPKARITPDDVQRREFGTARIRQGYVMHEVDEFLDEITDTLTAMQAENERLRAQLAAAPAPAARPAAQTAPAEGVAPADGGDRAAVQAFLRREKEFLQSLGSLVQGHAEELKGMVRSARASAAPEPPASSGPTAVAASSARATDAGDRPEPTASSPAEDVTTDGSPATDASTGETPDVPDRQPLDTAAAATPVPEAGDDVEAILGDDTATGTIEPVEAEEPIRVDEPEPTGSRRREEPAEGSLRELFWGEE